MVSEFITNIASARAYECE